MSEHYRNIETHQDGQSVDLPVFDGEREAPNKERFARWLASALHRQDAGVQLGSALTRPVKGAQPIQVGAVYLDEPGVSHLSTGGLVENHRYLPVEGADGQRYGGEDFEKGAWLGGRRAPNEYKQINVEVDGRNKCLWIITSSTEGVETGRVAVPFPQNLRGSSTTMRLFNEQLAATQVENPALDELLSDHFGRPVRMVRVDQQIVAGDEALPAGVYTKVWGNDGAPLHILSEESIQEAERQAIEQKGVERAAKLPHRPWRPDLVLQGAESPLVPHLEDEIALWAFSTNCGGHVLVQTVRGTPRCAGMQGQYGVVRAYRPKEPRDRRDGLKEGQQRPLFGVNAAVWGTRLGSDKGVVQVDSRVIPVAARPPFEKRWEGKWMS